MDNAIIIGIAAGCCQRELEGFTMFGGWVRISVLNWFWTKSLLSCGKRVTEVSFLISWISQGVLIWIGKLDTANDFAFIFDTSSHRRLRLIGLVELTIVAILLSTMSSLLSSCSVKCALYAKVSFWASARGHSRNLGSKPLLKREFPQEIDLSLSKSSSPRSLWKSREWHIEYASSSFLKQLVKDGCLTIA